jgi:uncharacterized protein
VVRELQIGKYAARAEKGYSSFLVGLPFIDEICWQLVYYANLYASIAATLNFIVRAPRAFAENMGKLMFWCGEDKILYGGETPIWHPR